MWRQGNSFVHNIFESVASFKQLDDEFFQSNRIVRPIMMSYLVTPERNREFNTIFSEHRHC